MTTARTSLVSELPLPKDRSLALRIVAKSVFKELRLQGFDRSDIVGFSSAMLELVSDDYRAKPEGDSDS